MKLNPRTYSLKKAEADLDMCNSLIVHKSEQYITLKKTADDLQKSIALVTEKKIYIKSVLKKKAETMKNLKSRRRIYKMLKQ